MKPKILYPTHLKKEPKKSHMTTVLTIVVSVTFALAVYTISSLEWEDRISIERGLCLFSLGFVFYTALYYLINNACIRTSYGQKLMKKFKLTQADVFDTSNKIVSAVQAVFSCISGATVCLYSCPRDLLRTSHYMSEAYAWFGAAYFFYDIWSMYKVHCSVVACSQMNGDTKTKSNSFFNFLKYVRYNPIIVGHHLFIGGFGFLVITYLRGGLGDCVFGFVYFMEFSTPFVSLRGILSKFGMKSTNWYVANGLIMLGTFFLCRVAMFPYVIYMYANFIQKDILGAIMTLPRGCKISIMILLLPQIYWFGLMLKGAKQVLRPKVLAGSALAAATTTASINTRKKKSSTSSNSHS